MFKEFDKVRLVRDVGKPKVPVGTIGYVVMVHNSEAYEVEFLDSEGRTLDFFAVQADHLQAVCDTQRS